MSAGAPAHGSSCVPGLPGIPVHRLLVSGVCAALPRLMPPPEQPASGKPRCPTQCPAPGERHEQRGTRSWPRTPMRSPTYRKGPRWRWAASGCAASPPCSSAPCTRRAPAARAWSPTTAAWTARGSASCWRPGRIARVTGSYAGDNKEFVRQYLAGEPEVEFTPPWGRPGRRSPRRCRPGSPRVPDRSRRQGRAVRRGRRRAWPHRSRPGRSCPTRRGSCPWSSVGKQLMGEPGHSVTSRTLTTLPTG